MFKTIEDFQKFSKDQFDAATQSATALSNGFQQIVAEASDFSKRSFENGTDLMQKLVGTKSVETAMQIQMEFAKSSYESAVSEATKLGGMMSSTAQDAFKPIEGAFTHAQNAVRVAA